MSGASLAVKHHSDEYIAEDICQGIVYSLDPAVLEESGAEFVQDGGFRVIGIHFFLCLGQSGEDTVWLCLTSKASPYNFGIARKRFLGGVWNGSDAYYHPRQLVLAKKEQVAKAAYRDFTRRGHRIYVDPFFVKEIADKLIPGWSS